MTTAGELREIANLILRQIEWMDDDEKIYTRCNTYGMNTVLEVDDGFIDYYEIEIDDEEE